jgi:hypothetical protein
MTRGASLRRPPSVRGHTAFFGPWQSALINTNILTFVRYIAIYQHLSHREHHQLCGEVSNSFLCRVVFHCIRSMFVICVLHIDILPCRCHSTPFFVSSAHDRSYVKRERYKIWSECDFSSPSHTHCVLDFVLHLVAKSELGRSERAIKRQDGSGRMLKKRSIHTNGENG